MLRLCAKHLPTRVGIGSLGLSLLQDFRCLGPLYAGITSVCLARVRPRNLRILEAAENMFEARTQKQVRKVIASAIKT